MSMKNSNNTIGNRTRDLSACSAVPQLTASPRAPLFEEWEDNSKSGMMIKNDSHNQERTNPVASSPGRQDARSLGRHVAQETILFFLEVTPNIWGPSVSKFHHITLVVTKIFIWFLDYWKPCAPLEKKVVTRTFFLSSICICIAAT